MSSGDDVPDPRSGPRAAVRWFLRSDDTAVVFVRETVSSALVVAMVGLLLFAVSGLWPPLVAVESGSMNPHLEKGDLVFVMEEDRFPPEAAHADTGVVTYQHGKEVGYRKFHSYGDVVVYEPDGSERATPVIHRARFYVQEGENWYDEADEDYLQPNWDNCKELPNCPAPNSGFITKGDANPLYDQVWGISRPVKEEWVRGTAEFRIPWLGWVRLVVSGSAVVPVPTAV
ncbi:S26 family signal peptidase [Halospeciosus flavus]|uniref:S26 family signal peptidase n=1 Tax=Halospeciosus flavus TaxID=3032283 RepID=A0ABD5Z795_9EURY|nr:S26 family signal peptidase [Halospeciosus flavus]